MLSTMFTEEYKRYLERLKHYVYMELVPKTAIFDYFTRHAVKTDYDEGNEPLMWYIRSAFYYDLTFSIYRLYDTKSDRNIYHFVRHAEAHASSIPWKKPLTSSDFEAQHDLLATVEAQKERLRLRRNKFFGHYDKQYFYEPGEIDTAYPFSNDDALALVRVLQQIVSKHSWALDLSAAVSMEEAVYVAAEKLYKRILELDDA